MKRLLVICVFLISFISNAQWEINEIVIQDWNERTANRYPKNPQITSVAFKFNSVFIKDGDKEIHYGLDGFIEENQLVYKIKRINGEDVNDLFKDYLILVPKSNLTGMECVITQIDKVQTIYIIN